MNPEVSYQIDPSLQQSLKVWSNFFGPSLLNKNITIKKRTKEKLKSDSDTWNFKELWQVVKAT